MTVMTVRAIMQPEVSWVGPRTSVRAAAALMLNRDIGMLPVIEHGRAVGIVTDRDLAVRLLPDAGGGLDRPVGAVMTPDARFCDVGHSAMDAARMMGEWRVRRLLVRDQAGRIVGVVSLGDIARDASEELAGQALGEIVEWR